MRNPTMIREKSMRTVRFVISIILITFIGLFSYGLYKTINELKRTFDESENLKNNEKIDWHNHRFIAQESVRRGFGENGVAEHLNKSENDIGKSLYNRNGFNALLSDHISLNRSLPDIRHPGCLTKKYLKILPSASVIIPFFDEHWSTLLRTIYSVINRAPNDLLKEIILVDDCSEKQFLKNTLDEYIETYLKNIVKIIRLKSRSGLIKARLTGAEAATGDVLLFLDSHIEANVNWLPPLLEPIARNYKVCVCPFIDVIDSKTFSYTAQDEGARGAFDWRFFYKRLPLRKEDVDNMPDPFPSPIMAGGLFAISAKFFWELGGYDPELDIWGGEQYELSFKIWLCGGELYDSPCSRIGHIYRDESPYENPRNYDYLTRNYKRVAEVWLDDYRNFLYQRDPESFNNVSIGDLSKQIAIRDKLNCKPFKYFIEKVAPDLIEKYPPENFIEFASGRIHSVLHPKYCVSALNVMEDESIKLKLCSKSSEVSEKFVMTYHRDLRLMDEELCWDVPDLGKSLILLMGCHEEQGNQMWRYFSDSQELKHVESGRCLEIDYEKKSIFVDSCKKSSQQKWNFDFVNKTALKNWDILGENLSSHS